MIPKEEAVIVLDYLLFEHFETAITYRISESLHHCGLCPAGIVLLSWHALVDFNGQLLFSFMIKASNDLTESSLVQFL